MRHLQAIDLKLTFDSPDSLTRDEWEIFGDFKQNKKIMSALEEEYGTCDVRDMRDMAKAEMCRMIYQDIVKLYNRQERTRVKQATMTPPLVPSM